MTKNRIGTVIVAAGESRRMNRMDKVFADLCGKPLLAWAVEAFQNSRAIDEIVVVLGRDKLEHGRRVAIERGWSKVSNLCLGGPRRQDSVRQGLLRLSGCDLVLIHDGARPLVSSDIIERGLAEVGITGAAIAAVPVKDTIKFVSPDGFVRDTPPREGLWAVQTPQVFRLELILEAHEKVVEDVTDDAMMVEKAGQRVKVFLGSYENIKVTTPDDLALAGIILRNRQS